MEKKETKVTPVKVTSTKPAAAEEEKAVKAAKKEATVEKEVKAEVSAAEEPKKENTKKAAPAKKTTTKKTASAKKKEVERMEEIYLQFGALEVTTKEVMDKAKQAYVAEGHRESSIKSIRLYLKPEEGMAYYVINDKFAGGISL
ncbi:MAG: hypothetical protein HFI71_02555 [Lachnospiraceae bacterium]|nr:hypothetical protein [Lachnospiraceae bacterium]